MGGRHSKKQQLHYKPQIKIVIVGDAGVGKTWLYTRFRTNSVPEEVHLRGEFLSPEDDGYYRPTLYDDPTYHPYVLKEGQTQAVALYDTAGSVDWDRIRLCSFPETDVFLCFFFEMSIFILK